ncbi:MAG TPA: Hpt domain-containing protein [Desulfuromonadales bacterium]|nr:Hpt domain-containing protein [Desulfuromonadales bacterium]
MCDKNIDNACVVEVESEIESIIPEFLENRKNDCMKVDLLVRDGAFGDLRTLGHRMKGAGGSYGFDEISEIGEAIEEGALNADSEAILAASRRLSDYLQRVTVVYV